MRKADLLHGLEAEITVDLGSPLRPRDPQPVRWVQRCLERLEAPLEILARRREEDDDPRARLAPSFCESGVPE